MNLLLYRSFFAIGSQKSKDYEVMGLLNLFRIRKPVVLDPLEAYEIWAETYDNMDDNALIAAEATAVKSMLPKLKLKGKRILDAGCGTGRYLQILKNYRPRLLTGIDFSQAMIVKANRKFANDRFVHLDVSSIESLPFRSDFFDTLLCTLALDHVRNLHAGVKELSRVLRKGGTAIISVFHPYAHLLGWQRTFATNNGNRKLYAVRYFSHQASEYFKAIKDAKFEIEELFEPTIDEEVKPFFVKAGRLDLYEKFNNAPLLLVFRLSKK
ncbi:MAG: class I SAM-dependent methyltransferase [Ignavibacteriales bacterium]|nr:class I SAM-dependent methyltransferase [Ignavibacteriales bacterium]